MHVIQVKCPKCGSTEVYQEYSGDIVEEDISFGINIVEYECGCEACEAEFNCIIHYAIADVMYTEQLKS